MGGGTENSGLKMEGGTGKTCRTTEAKESDRGSGIGGGRNMKGESPDGMRCGSSPKRLGGDGEKSSEEGGRKRCLIALTGPATHS